MVFTNRSNATKLTGLSYLGNINHSSKHSKAFDYDELVYTIYLAPANMSGYEVCPMRTAECTLLCLNESGHNKIKTREDKINTSRIKKTQLFFQNRDFFTKWVIAEIKSAKEKAEKLGYRFSVRLNNTSDLSPESFYTKIDGRMKNLLEIFPDTQFYDYTKIPKRIKLMKKYPNYDVTFSFSGENMDDCLKMLKKNVRVVMVFDEVPKKYLGTKVIDGDSYDMRYLDEQNVIVGLKFKKVRNQLDDNHRFVIRLKNNKE